MAPIGYMAMPEGFRYAGTAMAGRPKHERFDRFSLRHPRMDVGKRAKIFAPFDALTGFSDAVSGKNTMYTRRRLLSAEEEADNDRKLRVIASMTPNRRAAERNSLIAEVTYFSVCDDPESFSYGVEGRYVTLRGICRAVDTLCGELVLMGDLRIPINDIEKIESPDGIF